MSFMQDNVLASSHLITSSMDELNRAISAAGTTMSNSINLFNQLNYTKFMENVSQSISLISPNCIISRSSKISMKLIKEQKLTEWRLLQRKLSSRLPLKC